MSSDRPYVAENQRTLDRMRSIVAPLSDEELRRPVNESWTVAGVLGHIAFWDGRALALAEKLSRGMAFTASDDEPEDVDWINDASRPLIHAIPPRAAAELALRIAEQTDRFLADLAPELAARAWPMDPDSPLNLAHDGHRGEHLEEIEAALGR